MHRQCRFAHLLDLPAEAAARVGVDRESGPLTEPDLADLGFIDGGVDLHVAQVAGDHEEFGRLETGGNRLAGIDRALDHDAVDRGANRGAFEIGARLQQLRLALRDHRLGAAGLGLGHFDLGLAALDLLGGGIQHGARLLELGAGDEIALDQQLLALEIAPRFGQIHPDAGDRCAGGADVGLGGEHLGARRIEICQRLTYPVFEGLGVDAGNQLAALHLGVEVGHHLLHLAGNL